MLFLFPLPLLLLHTALYSSPLPWQGKMDDGATDQREEWRRGAWKVRAPGGPPGLLLPPPQRGITGRGLLLLSLSHSQTARLSLPSVCLSLSSSLSLPAFLFISISSMCLSCLPRSLFSLSFCFVTETSCSYSNLTTAYWSFLCKTLVVESLIRVLKWLLLKL